MKLEVAASYLHTGEEGTGGVTRGDTRPLHCWPAVTVGLQ